MSLEEKAKIGSSIHYLFNAYHSSNLEGNLCLQRIANLKELQAGDLPMLCSFLRQLYFSGKILLYLPENSQKEYAYILFHRGKIELVHHSDSNKKDLLLGQMFVAHGYLHGNDLKDFLEEERKEKLKNEGQDNHSGRIGDKLIAKNLLSPHALENILMEQIHVRLLSLSEREFFHFSIEPKDNDWNLCMDFHKDKNSKNSTGEATSEIKEEKGSFKQKPVFLSDVRLDFCLHNWIMSKVRIGWLKSLYTFYRDKEVFLNFDSYYERKNTNSLSASDQLYLMRFFIESAPSLANASNILNEKGKSLSLKNLFNWVKDQNMDENLFYKALYFATLKGVVRFVFQKESINIESLENSENTERKKDEYLIFLQGLHQRMQGQNSIELFYIMGGHPKMNTEEIHQIYIDFLEKVGPEKEGLSMEHKQTYEQILSWALQGREVAMECVSKNENSEDVANNILSFEVTKQLKAQQRIQEAQNLLVDFRTEEAFDLLEPFQDRGEKYKNFSACMLWIYLQRFIKNKNKISESKKTEALKNLDKYFHSISLEEESMEIPVYVKGLYHKMRGHLHEAHRCFKISSQLSPSFVPARREMNLFFLEKRDQKEEVTDSIKRVVFSAFSKSV